MEFFKKGKFEQCLSCIDKSLRSSNLSVSTQLLLENDALVCQYMLGKKMSQSINEDFKQLLLKSASLPPSEETSRLELTVLHNFIYSDILSSVDWTSKGNLASSYTQAARVFFRVYTFLQPLASSELRKDLPTDAEACCNVLVHRCIDNLPFTRDTRLLVPVCHVIGLLGVIEFRRSNWVPAIELLLSLMMTVEKMQSDIPEPLDKGFLLPLSLDDSAEPVTSCPLDWLNFLLGLAHFQRKRWKQSTEFLQRVKQDWFLSCVSYLTGLCLLNAGEFSKAVSAVGQRMKTTKITPVRLKAKMYNILGDCFGKLGKPQLSIQMYKEALSADFGYLLPLHNISVQYQELGASDVMLECLNLLVTSLESDVGLDTPGQGNQRYISMLDDITTDDNNVSYPVALYRLANRCLQLERFDAASQKYQDLIAFLTDSRRNSKIFLKACLPSLRNIHHEAILALLKAGKYSNCLSLCDKVIACYHKGQDHYLDTQFSVDSSQMSDVVSSANLSEHQNENNNDFLNNNFNHNIMDNEPRVRYDNMAGTQTLKRKRQDSDSEPSSSVIGNLNFDIKGQSVSHDSKDNSCMADESNEIDKLTCDVIALKYKANVLEKMAETNAAIDCLESAIDSISVHRKTTLQKSLQKTLKNSDDLDHPAAKRQRLSIHGDPGQRSGGEAIAADCDALTQFEAELYQSLGTMLSGQGQYADALHYYRLAAQLLPDSTKIHFLCTKTLLSMKCPKVASANWLKHRELPHTSSYQVSCEIARKQEILRNTDQATASEEMDYNQLDVQCLTVQQQFLKSNR